MAAGTHSRIDFSWAYKVGDMLACQPEVDCDGVVRSLEKLNTQLSLSDQINLTRLRNKLLSKETEWRTSGSLSGEGLTEEFMQHALVLYLYTLNDPPVFHYVSSTMHSPTRSATSIQCCIAFVGALERALQRLPDSFLYNGEAWRGIKYAYPEGYYFPGKVFMWFEEKSITFHKDLMYSDDFCGLEGRRTVFIIKNCSGKMIERFSDFPDEHEILLPALQGFKVLSVTKQCIGDHSNGDPFLTADLVELEMVDLSKADKTRYVLIIGDTGDGKSTLINGFRDESLTEEAVVDLDVEGVTKDVTDYLCKPIESVPLVLIDTPGVGDHEVDFTTLLGMIETRLSAKGKPMIDGVIVTHKTTEPRLKLGPQLSQFLIKEGFMGEHKWNSIILCGTQSDQASDKLLDHFKKKVAPKFFEDAGAPAGEGVHVVVNHGDFSELQTAISRLPATYVQYKNPDIDVITAALAKKIGLLPEHMSAKLKAVRADFDVANDMLEELLLMAVIDRAQFDQARNKFLTSLGVTMKKYEEEDSGCLSAVLRVFGVSPVAVMRTAEDTVVFRTETDLISIDARRFALPLIEAVVANQRFDKEKHVKGDIEVKTEKESVSIKMANVSTRLAEFAGISVNQPMLVITDEVTRILKRVAQTKQADPSNKSYRVPAPCCGFNTRTKGFTITTFDCVFGDSKQVDKGNCFCSKLLEKTKYDIHVKVWHFESLAVMRSTARDCGVAPLSSKFVKDMCSHVGAEQVFVDKHMWNPRMCVLM